MVSNYLEASILALIQGFSEFIPVSSSAHLILVSKMSDPMKQFWEVLEMQIPDEKEPESCVEVFIESMLSWCCSKKIFVYKHCSSILDCDLEIEEPEVIMPSITKLTNMV